MPADPPSNPTPSEPSMGDAQPLADTAEPKSKKRYVPKPPAVNASLSDLIERVTKLPLSDSVNVAIFLLTIISIFLSLVGLYIAKVTLDTANFALKDAHESGDAQLDNLKATREAMEHARALLETENSRQEQLVALRANVSLNLSCTSVSAGKTLSVVSLTNLRGPSETKWAVKNLSVPKSRRALCSFELENTGEGPLYDGFVLASFVGSGNALSRGATNLLEEPHDYLHPVVKSVNGYDFIQVIKNESVFPKKQNAYRRWEPISLVIPQGTEMMSVSYFFGGRSYPEKFFSIKINLK